MGYKESCKYYGDKPPAYKPPKSQKVSMPKGGDRDKSMKTGKKY